MKTMFKFLVMIHLTMGALVAYGMDARLDDNGYYLRSDVRHSGKITILKYEKKNCFETYSGTFQDSFTGEILKYSGSKKSCGWVGPNPVSSERVEIQGVGTFPVYHLNSGTQECSLCHGQPSPSPECRQQCGCRSAFCGSW